MEKVHSGDQYKGEGIRLISSKEINFEQLNSFDSKIFGTQRNEKLLKIFSTHPEIITLVAIDDQSGEIVGFGSARALLGVDGFRIGPLQANNGQIAGYIFWNLVQLASKDGNQFGLTNESKVFIELPDINQEAQQLAKYFQMKAIFPCMRMFTDDAPKTLIEKSFACAWWETTY